MEGYRLTEERVAGFRDHLEGEEHGKATVEKYVRNVRFFAAWLDGGEVSREAVARRQGSTALPLWIRRGHWSPAWSISGKKRS